MNYYQKTYPYIAKQERRLQKKTARIFANSKRVFNQLLEEEKIGSEKLRLIYNGLDLAKYERQTPSLVLRESLNISMKTLVIIMVANLFFYKGHMDLLKALVLIKNRLPKDWTLLCVGRDEGCLQDLCNYAAENSIASHIQWLDQRDDVPALLSLSNIGILCSHQEGFSNSVIEGMAAGLPMIVTDVGGNSEAVINNHVGFVVPPKDPATLAKAIVKLAWDNELRERMGAEAIERVRTHFSLEHCIKVYKEMYAELD